MVELPKDEAELQAYVDSKIQERETDWKKEKDKEFAAQRTKHQAEIDKIKADMGKSAEQIAEERIKEQQEKDAKELAELRSYKKNTILAEKLAKEGLPSHFKYDTRLLSAEDGDLDKVIKDVKKEYEATLPKGNTKSTIIQQGGNRVETNKDDHTRALESLGNSIKEIIGR